MSVVFWLIEWTRKRRLKKLKNTGIIIQGRVEKIFEEPFEKFMVIRVIAKSSELGKDYSFRSEIDWKDEELNLDVGDSVKILVDLSNPKQDYFDATQCQY